MKYIFVLTCSSQSLSSVEVISKDIENVYVSLKGPALKVEVVDVNNRKFLERDFSSVEEISFVSAHPGVIGSEAFLKVAKEMKLSDRLIIHVYGDFLRQARFFFKAQKHLISKSVVFLPPTKTYGKILEKVIANTAGIIPTPFPVRAREYALISPEDFKREYGINDEIVLVYGGRISRQKNVDKLIEWFNSLSPSKKYKLFIIGKFDDFEVGTVGNNLKLGELYQKLQVHESQSIVFIDHLSQDKLYDFFYYSDYFVSFSTYHDEDFGRAPVEAILCGSRCILTDWGGYRDLIQEFPSYSQKMNVSLRPEGLEIEADSRIELTKREKLPSPNALYMKHDISNFRSSIIKFLYQDLPPYIGGTEVLFSLYDKDKSFFYQKDGKLLIDNYKKIYDGFGTNI